MTTVHFYMAGRFSRRSELRELADGVERSLGWRSTARWLTGAHDDLGQDADPGVLEQVALEDLIDIAAANVVFVFTEVPGTPGAPRGGRHVEFGWALAKGKDIVVIGPRENVFCALVPCVASMQDALDLVWVGA